MKKVLSMTVSGLLILSMSACSIIPANIGGANDNEQGLENINVYDPSREVKPDANSEDETIDDITDIPDDEPVIEDPLTNTDDERSYEVLYERGQTWLSAWSEETYERMTEVGYDYLEISDNYPELKEFFEIKKESDGKIYEENERMYEDDWKTNLQGTGMEFLDVLSLNVTRADSQFFSVTECRTEGYGDFVDMYYTVYNLNSETGELLNFDSFLYESDNLYEYMAEYLLKYYGDFDLYFDDVNDIVEYFKAYFADGSINDSIAVMPDGVVFVFNQYDLSGGYSEYITIPLYYSDYPEFFVENCFKSYNKEYLMKLAPGMAWYEDTDGDGERDKNTIEFVTEYSEIEEMYCYSEIIISNDGLVTSCEIWSEEIPDLYVAKKNGNLYLYVESTSWGVGKELEVKVLDTESFWLKNVETYYGYIKSFGSFDNIVYRPLLGIFSTYLAEGDYYIDDDGRMVKKSEFLTILDMEDYPLQTVKDLYGYKVDGKLNVSDEVMDIKEGTTLYFKYTDGDNKVIFETDDGNLVLLERDNYETQVCGYNEYEAFDILWYYG